MLPSKAIQRRTHYAASPSSATSGPSFEVSSTNSPPRHRHITPRYPDITLIGAGTQNEPFRRSINAQTLEKYQVRDPVVLDKLTSLSIARDPILRIGSTEYARIGDQLYLEIVKNHTKSSSGRTVWKPAAAGTVTNSRVPALSWDGGVGWYETTGGTIVGGGKKKVGKGTKKDGLSFPPGPDGLPSFPGMQEINMDGKKFFAANIQDASDKEYYKIYVQDADDPYKLIDSGYLGELVGKKIKIIKPENGSKEYFENLIKDIKKELHEIPSNFDFERLCKVSEHFAKTYHAGYRKHPIEIIHAHLPHIKRIKDLLTAVEHKALLIIAAFPSDKNGGYIIKKADQHFSKIKEIKESLPDFDDIVLLDLSAFSRNKGGKYPIEIMHAYLHHIKKIKELLFKVEDETLLNLFTFFQEGGKHPVEVLYQCLPKINEAMSNYDENKMVHLAIKHPEGVFFLKEYAADIKSAKPDITDDKLMDIASDKNFEEYLKQLNQTAKEGLTKSEDMVLHRDNDMVLIEFVQHSPKATENSKSFNLDAAQSSSEKKPTIINSKNTATENYITQKKAPKPLEIIEVNSALIAKQKQRLSFADNSIYNKALRFISDERKHRKRYTLKEAGLQGSGIEKYLTNKNLPLLSYDLSGFANSGNGRGQWRLIYTEEKIEDKRTITIIGIFDLHKKGLPAW